MPIYKCPAPLVFAQPTVLFSLLLCSWLLNYCRMVCVTSFSLILQGASSHKSIWYSRFSEGGTQKPPNSSLKEFSMVPSVIIPRNVELSVSTSGQYLGKVKSVRPRLQDVVGRRHRCLDHAQLARLRLLRLPDKVVRRERATLRQRLGQLGVQVCGQQVRD